MSLGQSSTPSESLQKHPEHSPCKAECGDGSGRLFGGLIGVFLVLYEK